MVKGAPKLKDPAPLPPPPKLEDPMVQQAAKDARLAEKRRKGRQSTILTGGLGDASASSVATKTLLGM